MKEECSSKKIMIIGGAGFIGSHLADLCQEKGYETFIYDNFSTGKESHLRKIPNSNIIKGDILDSQNLCNVMDKINPECVFHLAAIHHIPTCEKEPLKSLRVNVEGTMSVLSSSSKVKKIIFTSTGALYDPAYHKALKEDSPLKTSDIYSISKMACENLLEYWAKKNGVPVIAARLFNTVGRRETNRHLIPDVLDQLIEGKREIRLGNLTPLRDYIHVEDVADALIALLNLQIAKEYEVFNVGTGIEYSVLDLVNLFSQVIGEQIKAVSVSELQRKIDRPTQRADATKLRTLTNWEPKRTLQQALKEVWEEARDKRKNVE